MVVESREEQVLLETVDLDAIKREVTEIYCVHNPQKLGQLGALWRKYQGQCTSPPPPFPRLCVCLPGPLRVPQSVCRSVFLTTDTRHAVASVWLAGCSCCGSGTDYACADLSFARTVTAVIANAGREAVMLAGVRTSTGWQMAGAAGIRHAA